MMKRVIRILSAFLLAMGVSVTFGTSANAASTFSPYGHIDILNSPAPGHIRIAGWMIDPDAYDSDDYPIATQFLVYLSAPPDTPESQFVHTDTADKLRPDVAAAYPGTGDHHGFDILIPTDRTGTVPVYVLAVNQGAGNNTLIGSGTVQLGSNVDPFGSFDKVSSTRPLKMKVAGWAIDPSSPTTPVRVRVQVYYGTTLAEDVVITANRYRSTLAEAYPHAGGSHAFRKWINLSSYPTKNRSVVITALNVGEGTDKTLGVRQVVLR